MAPVPGDSSKHQFGTQMPQGGHPPHHSITSSASASSWHVQALISNPLAHLNLGVADHRAPFLEVEFDLFGELFRRAADRLIAEFCHALLDVGQPNDLD